MLAIAGREADIVHLMPRPISTGVLIDDPRDRLTAAVAEKVERLRHSAGDRRGEIELSLGVTIVVSDERRAATERLIQDRGWQRVSVEEVWDMPSIAVGSVEQIVADLEERRATLGFSYLIVPDAQMDASAPVVTRLAGR